MTVSTTVARADATGNGVTVAFTVPFYFLDNAHLLVIRTQISTGVATTLMLTTDYTVTGAGVPAGGTVTTVATMTVDQRISILRNVPLTQLSHYVPNDPFPSATHEQIVDQLTMEAQQLNETISRALVLSANSSGVSGALPSPTASNLLGWNSGATALQNYGAGALGVTIAYAAWSTSTFNGTGAQTAFVLGADAGSASNCDVAVGGVAQTPGINFSYTAATKTVTFLTGAPAVGTSNVVVRYGQALPQGTIVSANISDATATGIAVLTAASAAAARAATGAAASGANTDITSLTGLTSQVGLSPSTIGQFRNLAASATGLSASISVTADEICVESASGLYQTLRGVSLTVNSAANGANGLDTGSLATSTFYSSWVIYNPTTLTTAGLISLSATAPTLPSGYTHKARTGWVRTDSTGSKFPLAFRQFGRRTWYVVGAGTNVTQTPRLSTGAVGTPPSTYATVSLSAFVPPTATVWFGDAGNPSINGTFAVAPSSGYGSSAATTNPPPVCQTGGSSDYVHESFEMEVLSANAYYFSNSGSYLNCRGYEDNL